MKNFKRKTFDKMIGILDKAYKTKHQKGRRKSKLGIEDMLLATLEYMREYRTYFHIANDYGVSEGNIYKIIRWVEDTLIKDGTFNLSGKKLLYGEEIEYEVILIDALETPIQRPKKTMKILFGEKEKPYNKIISDKYRNRRKCFGLRFNLISGIYNFELDC